MDRSIADAAATLHRLSLEVGRARAAKANLKNPETPPAQLDMRVAVGRAVARARQAIGWTQDELAGAIATVLEREKFDAAQIARWEAAKERPQFDVLLAIPVLRWPLILCLAELDERVEVVTEIRRRA